MLFLQQQQQDQISGICRISRSAYDSQFSLHSARKSQVETNLFPLTTQWALILLALYITALLYGLDTTVVADVQGTVIQRFGQPEKLAWIGVGFPLGSIALILSL